MTTSGTYSGGLPFDDLLVEAWERIGKSPVIMTGALAESTRRSLTYLMVQWTNTRAPLWQIVPVVVTTAVGVPTIVLGAQYADVMDLYVTVSGVDLIMGKVGRSDYLAYPNKTIAGRPTQVWVERQLVAPVMHLYPAPDQVYSITAYCLRQPADASALTQTADAPYLWSEALASGLTAKLAEKFAPDRFAEKAQLAQAAFNAAIGESRERVNLRIMPVWS
jgi:hypothetical protein